MKQVALTRGALLGTVFVALTLTAAGTANAQTYPPGTNCQSLLPNLRTACINQAQQMNSANPTVIPNSSGSNTVPTPGTNNTNSGTNVVPGGTVSPNAVNPSGTVNPNAVGTPNSAPAGNPIILPPAGAGTNGTGTTGTGTTGTGTTGSAGGASGGASGN